MAGGATTDRDAGGFMLPETSRQIVAGLAAAVSFLLLYIPLSLVFWLALLLSLAVYAAALLLIRRQPPPSETMLTDGVSEADLHQALAALAQSSNRLRALEARAPVSDRGLFDQMADLLQRIRQHHVDDPRDLRHTRRFLRHDLPRLVETSESYVDLASKAAGDNLERVARLGERIRGFAPVLERIDQACLENDFLKLEVEAEVLSGQLESR
ncbi:MAG: 5-bromo-4-chloroindolyl phosphate hydrolysis family protein [Neomegalonema sp.]|nr:5-bromo-4-chloroindolyl phosphate hydrolysis family protein [Neomegalonema sp.]